MDSLASWLKRLHKDCKPGQFQEYIDSKRVGLKPISATSNRIDDLLHGMRESAQNFGSRYVLLGLNLVIEP